MRRAVQSLTFHSLIESALRSGPYLAATGAIGAGSPSTGAGGTMTSLNCNLESVELVYINY